MFEWIQANYIEVFAIIGMAYSLGLAIVKLTPTPKDDEALEKVASWLKFIAKIFGLDLKQGINKKDS